MSIDIDIDIDSFNEGLLEDRSAIHKVLEHLRGARCESCDIASWNGRPLILLVDNIDGQEDDNNPENLRLICPNCRSQKY